MLVQKSAEEAHELLRHALAESGLRINNFEQVGYEFIAHTRSSDESAGEVICARMEKGENGSTVIRISSEHEVKSFFQFAQKVRDIENVHKIIHALARRTNVTHLNRR